MTSKKVPEYKFWNFLYLLTILVDHDRENWSCIFSDLQTLDDQLDELDIEFIVEAKQDTLAKKISKCLI